MKVLIAMTTQFYKKEVNMSKEITLGRIEDAIDNGWSLRPVSGTKFINIDYEEGTKLADERFILNEVSDLNKFPPGITAVALIPELHEDFVCLDMDFLDEKLKSQIWSLLSSYKKSDLFLRLGNPDKMGQLWFKCYDQIKFASYKKLDIITTQKRCDAIGLYKAENDIEYEWPYKNPWENLPDELPIISKDLIDQVIETVTSFFGIDKKTRNSGSRHDALVDMAMLGVKANRRPNDILNDLFGSDEYKSLLGEPKRDANAEVANALSWAMRENAKYFVSYVNEKSEKKSGLDVYDIPPAPPKVEPYSFFDIIYRSIRRNQIVENKKMAVVTTLSICSWLLTLSCRFRGLAPNLFLLLIAPSGSGKSTSSQVINEIIKLDKRLKKSFGGNDIRTDSAIFATVQESPIVFYHIDEATKTIKSSKNKLGHNANIAEILSQLYSDYKDNDVPIALARIKNESYGVAIGAKAVLMMSSTESFWKVFDEENYTQGLGRRLFIVQSSDIPLQKKDKKYYKDFFFNQEKIAISMFLRGYLDKNGLFDTEDISDYGILKEVENKNGVKRKIYHKNCFKPNIQFEMSVDDEVELFLADQFIEDNNNFKIQAAGSGSTIQQRIANSRGELILKLAMIHAVCGKKLMAEGDRPTELVANINTMIKMDSIDWATKMFNYYMIGSTMEHLDSLYKKDIEIDKSNKVIEDFIERLKEKEVEDFMKSDQVVRNFFKNIGGADYRNKILKEMQARDLIIVDGDIDAYRCKVRLK